MMHFVSFISRFQGQCCSSRSGNLWLKAFSFLLFHVFEFIHSSSWRVHDIMEGQILELNFLSFPFTPPVHCYSMHGKIDAIPCVGTLSVHHSRGLLWTKITHLLQLLESSQTVPSQAFWWGRAGNSS